MQEAQFAKSVAWLLRLQAGLVALSGVAFAIFGSTASALAALGGGLLGILLTVVAALRLLMGSSAAGSDARALVGAFYRAMAMKMVLAVVLFVVVAKWFSGYFGPVLTGYAATIVAYWLALWRLALPKTGQG